MADQIIEIRRERVALAVHRAVKPRVHVRAVLAGACVAFHTHAEVLRRARDCRADGADAKKPELPAPQRPGRRRIPAPGGLRCVLLEDPALVREEVREHVLGHQPAEDAARIGQDVVAAQRRIEQRLDAGPRRLRPAQRRHGGQHLSQERRLTERQVVLAGARRGVSGIARGRHLEIGQARGVNEAVIVARVARQDQQPVHAALSSHAVAVSRFLRRMLVVSAVVEGPRPHGRRRHGGRSRSRRREERMRRLRSGLRFTRRGFHLFSLAAEAPKREGGQKQKGHHLFEVMALGSNSAAVGFWLYHPVVVGRLMPTLIRTRDAASREHSVNYQR